jgi:formate/nitrite transporter FocA (FNT family)
MTLRSAQRSPSRSRKSLPVNSALPARRRSLHTLADVGLGAHGLLTNIAITTVGNLVGGTVLVALPFQLVAKLAQQDR